jgi:hypothetical protein
MEGAAVSCFRPPGDIFGSGKSLRGPSRAAQAPEADVSDALCMAALCGVGFA